MLIFFRKWCSIIVVYSVVSLYIQITIVATFECLTFMNSTCPNNVLTEWNNLNVGKNLKEWIQSVTVEILDQNTALAWKLLSTRGNHCKTISITRYDYFAQFDPELYSSNVTILGKIDPNDDGQDWFPYERQFVGPIWAAINDPWEWYIHEEDKVISGLVDDATLHNGFYYGILNNEYLRIGKSIYYLIQIILFIYLAALFCFRAQLVFFSRIHQASSCQDLELIA